MNAKGSLFEMLGRWPDAAILHEESQQLFQNLGDEQGIASTFLNLALIDYDQGHAVQASVRFKASLDHWQRRADQRGEAATRIPESCSAISVQRYRRGG